MLNKKIGEKNLFYQSTLFYVSSPFQILCALEAIHYYNISQYHFFLGITGDIRDKQMIILLNQLNISYTLFPLDKITNKLRISIILDSFFKKSNRKYNQVFIGNYYVLDFYIHSFQFLNKKSNIIYLDDGTNTINILKGEIETNIKFKIFKTIISFCVFLKGINRCKFYFTIFSDIKTKHFKCFENKFSFLEKNKQQNPPSDIFFIGTNVKGYCSELNISINDFLNKLEAIFNNLTQNAKKEKIIYIPHGRDSNGSIRKLCIRYGIEYRRLDVAIEYYMFKENKNPKSVYGFTSTALFNLKKMYNDTFVCNICLKGNNPYYNRVYKTITEYYTQHGISLYTNKIL